MSYQAPVRPDLEVSESRLLLGSLEPLLHMPAAQADPKQFDGIGLFAGIADQILPLVGVKVLHHDQPILPIRRGRRLTSPRRVLRHLMHPGGLHLPGGVAI